MGMGREALVVCSERSMGTGIRVWDIHTGEHLLHIPTCASPPRGLLCLKNKFLFASQVHRHGSLGGGAIFIWPLNKPQAPLRSYPMEAIGPISCTKDCIYLVGGALSGNAYLWEVGTVSNGRLRKTWRAHQNSINCILFSDDDSLLISGSDDGMICTWSMISLLDTEDYGSSPSPLHYSLEHRSSITGLLSTHGSLSSIFVSSSLDGTCKVWDLISGTLIQTRVYPLAVTTIVLHPGEQLLFSGSVDGSIFGNMLGVGLEEDPFIVAEDQPVVLKGHNGSITALTFCGLGLLSTSEDCTICLWDVINSVIIRRFNIQKGPVTNLIVIPRSSLLSASNHRRVSNQFRVALLEKYPQPANTSNGITTTLFSCHSLKENQTSIDFQSTDSLNQQIFDLEHEQTPAAMQLKVETSMENRMWATRMTKHVMEMNKHLQSRLLDLLQCRLIRPTESDTTTKKRKRLIEYPSEQGEEKSESPA